MEGLWLKVLVLTPDTDIDRRIILQANTLIKNNFEVTIIGVPYSGDNFLSGRIDEKITVKRIDLQHIEYHSRLVKFYKSAHRKIMDFAYKRNDFLNSYSNKRLVAVTEDSSLKKVRTLKNKMVSFNTKCINYFSTLFIRLVQKAINVLYTTVLKVFRLFNVNFFPIFDKAFYEAAIKEEADLIVANDLPSLKAGYMIAKEKNIPLIYDAHENYTEQCTLPKRYAKLLEKIEAEVLPEVDFWIVPNELLGESIINKYKKKYAVHVKDPLVIQNAVDKWGEYPQFKTCNLLHKKLGIDSKKKILLFQGGFLAKRNLENLVKSMKFVKNENIVLVMLGFGTYGEVLKNIARKSKVIDKVYFMDAVPQTELLKYTCSADVGIIPYPAIDNNTYFCSPNKLYEFIQARLPILANDLPFLKKVIVGQGIGMVQDFSNPQMIAAAIDSFFEDETKLKQCKERINEVAEHFNWQVEEEKLLKQYLHYATTAQEII